MHLRAAPHPESAALSVSAILRAMVSVLVICALALARAPAVAATAPTGPVAGAAAAPLPRVGVMMLAACAVVLRRLLKACQPAGGLTGVTWT